MWDCVVRTRVMSGLQSMMRCCCWIYQGITKVVGASTRGGTGICTRVSSPPCQKILEFSLPKPQKPWVELLSYADMSPYPPAFTRLSKMIPFDSWTWDDHQSVQYKYECIPRWKVRKRLEFLFSELRVLKIRIQMTPNMLGLGITWQGRHPGRA